MLGSQQRAIRLRFEQRYAKLDNVTTDDLIIIITIMIQFVTRQVPVSQILRFGKI